MKNQLAVVVLTSCLAAGCMPYQWYDTPAATGELLDGVSGLPIQGAAVVIKASASDHSTTTETGADGKFEAPAGTHWTLVPLGLFDPLNAHALITITAPGYQKFEWSQSPYQDWNQTVRLEPIANREQQP